MSFKQIKSDNSDLKNGKILWIIKNPYFIISFFFLLFILFLALLVVGYINDEPVKKPIIVDKMNNLDYEYMYDFYFSATPNLNGRICYGNENSPIVMTVYIDFGSDVSRNFINSTFIQLKTEFIDKGLMKYCHKNFLNSNDYYEKESNQNYLYAQSIECFKQKNPDNFYDFYFGLFNISDMNEIMNLSEFYGISKKEMYDCIMNESFFEIIEDFSEVENFGITLNPRFYIGIKGIDNTIIEGVPSYTKLWKTIINQQIILGNEVVK